MTDRLQRLRARLKELELDALIVTRIEDQLYLVGFAGHADYDSVLVVSGDDAMIATDFRYWESAARQAPHLPLAKLERGKYALGDALADFAQTHHLKTIGFEAQHVSVFWFRQWQKRLRRVGAKLKPTNDLVKWLRAVKDDDEIEKIRRAVKLTDDAFAYFVAQVRPGMTERQAAWLIESYMRENGAERLAFDPIIASGPNAALPHAQVTERVLGEGEPIIVDCGAQVDGYCADLTRTITLGYATEKFLEIYHLVLKAQLTVEHKAHIGMTGRQVDRLARRVIEKAGYGEQFGHGTGHGVGRMVHEFPRAGKFLKDRIEPNMTLTVEPGIYLPGWGGVRIEDLVVFRKEGLEVLSQASKEPLVQPVPHLSV